MQLALKRLSPKETYDRVFRIRRATQCSYQHKLLPKADWTKPEEVTTAPPFQHDHLSSSANADFLLQ